MSVKSKKILRIVVLVFLFLVVVLSIYVLDVHRSLVIEIDFSEKRGVKECRQEGCYRKESMDGIPIIIMSGSGYNLGYQHGLLLKGEINEIWNEFYSDVIYKNKILGLVNHTLMIRQAKKINRFIPEQYQHELQGIADGSGRSYNEILILNTYFEMLNGYQNGPINLIMLPGEQSPTYIQATNRDSGFTFLASKNAVFKVNFGEKNDYIYAGLPGSLGLYSGINNQGIMITGNNVITKETKQGMPLGILLKQILEQASNFSQAAGYIEDSRVITGGKVIISSLSEDLVGPYEFFAGQAYKQDVTKSLAIINNNFHLSQTKNSQRDFQENSAAKEEFINNKLAGLKQVRINDIQEIMSDYNIRLVNNASVANNNTVFSFIIDPENMRIFLAKGIQPPVTEEGYAAYNYSFNQTK